MSAVDASARGFTPVTFFSRMRIIRSFLNCAVELLVPHVLADAELAPLLRQAVADEHARVQRLAVCRRQHDVRRDQRSGAAELVVVADGDAVVELGALDRRAADDSLVRLLLHQLADVGEVARIVGETRALGFLAAAPTAHAPPARLVGAATRARSWTRNAASSSGAAFWPPERSPFRSWR